MSLLEVKRCKKTYTARFGNQQVHALKNINFSVEEGEYGEAARDCRKPQFSP